jgi:hypothetical protein
VQEATSAFLAPLVEGCSLHSTATVTGVLQLGLALDWSMLAEDMSPLEAAVSRRLAEAADLGHFASPGSPLGALAAKLANKMLIPRSELKLPALLSRHHPPCGGECCMLYAGPMM